MHLRASKGSLRLSSFIAACHKSAGHRSVTSSLAVATRTEVSFISDGSGASANSHHARSKPSSITSPALALRRERVQMLVRVTALPPVFAAAQRFATGGSKVSGIIMAVPTSTNPPTKAPRKNNLIKF